MLRGDALDVTGHGRRVRRLLEASGYHVASVGAQGENLITIISPPARHRERVSAGRLRLDPDLQELACADRNVELTLTETSIMHVLLRHADTVVSQSELIATLWPEDDPATCKNRLYAHIFTLRRKLAQVSARARIRTAQQGYRLALDSR